MVNALKFPSQALSDSVETKLSFQYHETHSIYLIGVNAGLIKCDTLFNVLNNSLDKGLELIKV